MEEGDGDHFQWQGFSQGDHVVGGWGRCELENLEQRKSVSGVVVRETSRWVGRH